MTAIAFYAPMKAPDHPVPSGDRAMARALLALLNDDERHMTAELVSRLRMYDRYGDDTLQSQLCAQAESEADALIAKGKAQGWRLWVTYHNYYKAPDLIGPVVSDALGIPYVILESSRAAKRLDGKWRRFEIAAGRASDAADVLISFTQSDNVALSAARKPGQRLVVVPPFLHRSHLPEQIKARDCTRFITVAMMREGAKRASYLRLADVLSRLDDLDWSLEIIGDGPAEEEIREWFRPLGARVRFLGWLSQDEIAQHLDKAGLFLWPGIDEAFGISYLEAQAAGLAVLAETGPGVREVVHPGGLVASDAPDEYAARIRTLMTDHAAFEANAEAGRRRVAERHLFPAARTAIWRELDPLLEVA